MVKLYNPLKEPKKLFVRSLSVCTVYNDSSDFSGGNEAKLCSLCLCTVYNDK